jgi:hypothetical protein
MYNMSWKVTVSKYQLMMIDAIEIIRSVEKLSDMATITLPATAYNAAIGIESKIKRGDAIVIEFGYNGGLYEEFNGYLNSIQTDNGSLILECEDGLFQYRKSLDNIELKGASVTDVLNHVNKAIGGFTLKCDYDFKYDKFVINNATGYDVLKKIQEEAKPNIYLKGKTLHVHPQYSELFGTADYDFSRNIETEELKYRNADERKFIVIVESKGKDGKVIRVEAGTTGGDKMTINVSGVTDMASLRKLANEALATKVYTGYEGTFTGWLLPYCDAGYKVSITDKDYEAKNGSYYVLEVKTNFSKSGGVRTIKLGKKL